MMETYVSRLFATGFTSGIEGPACDKEGNVYATNYLRNGTIGKITPNGAAEVFISLPNGSESACIRFDADSNMYAGDYLGHNIYRIDMKTREIKIFAHEPIMSQPNDMAITRDGVIFASDPNWDDSTGRIWKINRDGEVTLLEEDMGTTNGIEVSNDGTKLYVNETIQRNLWCYDLKEGLEPINKRLIHQFDDFGTDGMRCDTAGNLFVTRYGKGVVAMINPKGEQIREIPVGGKLCTNVTFGGKNGRTCYVTVADQGEVYAFETEEPGRCRGMFAS